MLEQKQRQFWNRQRVPNKSIISDFRFSHSVFCYFRLNNKNVVFFPYNFYISIKNVLWIENGDEIRKSEMILLLGIFDDSKTVFVFLLALFVIEFYTFENGQRKKKQENNYKNKTKPKFEKSLRTKCFLFLILRMYAKFHKNRSINKKKSTLKPGDPLNTSLFHSITHSNNYIGIFAFARNSYLPHIRKYECRKSMRIFALVNIRYNTKLHIRKRKSNLRMIFFLTDYISPKIDSLKIIEIISRNNERRIY